MLLRASGLNAEDRRWWCWFKWVSLNLELRQLLPDICGSSEDWWSWLHHVPQHYQMWCLCPTWKVLGGVYILEVSDKLSPCPLPSPFPNPARSCFADMSARREETGSFYKQWQSFPQSHHSGKRKKAAWKTHLSGFDQCFWSSLTSLLRFHPLDLPVYRSSSITSSWILMRTLNWPNALMRMMMLMMVDALSRTSS